MKQYIHEQKFAKKRVKYYRGGGWDFSLTSLATCPFLKKNRVSKNLAPSFLKSCSAPDKGGLIVEITLPQIEAELLEIEIVQIMVVDFGQCGLDLWLGGLDSGRAVSISSRLVSISGGTVSFSGRAVSISGRTVSISGRTVSISVRMVSIQAGWQNVCQT